MTTPAQPQDRASLGQEQFLKILSREEAVRRFDEALFPRGIDVVLVHDDLIVAIPRTTRLNASGA